MIRKSQFCGLILCCLVAWARPAGGADDGLKKDIDRAVKRGVAYLKDRQAKDGSWFYQENALNTVDDHGRKVGPTALAGLTLLECGVAAKDAAVQKAADFVRKGSVQLTATYSLSLAIMFLDRLGDPTDVPFIESMAVRLLAGQNAQGGWSYQCPDINQQEKARMVKYVAEREKKVKKGEAPPKQARVRTVRDLPQEIVAQLLQLTRKKPGAALDEMTPGGDNSNTQFAILALWLARKHGFPVQEALKRSGQRFRLSQQTNGGWTYAPSQAQVTGMNMTTATMTCAGLLGLGLTHGAINDQAKEKGGKARRATDPDKDAAIKKGLAALATAIGKPAGKDKDVFPKRMERAGRAYYFLWSLERVAMAFGLDVIGGKDWYRWGAEILIANQKGDGSWHGDYGDGGVDTSFALLLLRRSNLVPDLTAVLKGRIKNAGVVALRSGGIGGGKLTLGEGMEKGITNKKRPDQGTEKRLPKAKPPVIEASPQEQDKEIARLSGELVQAPAAKQTQVLNKLKQGKGVVFTEALAGAIPLLKGGLKAKARDALAQRLTRMSADTLRDKLKDENLEIRRAAALACAKKGSKKHIPDLIALLEDPELPVALAAHEALKDLSGKDFGPDADATRAERKEAVAQWKAWWRKQDR